MLFAVRKKVLFLFISRQIAKKHHWDYCWPTFSNLFNAMGYCVNNNPLASGLRANELTLAGNRVTPNLVTILFFAIFQENESYLDKWHR